MNTQTIRYLFGFRLAGVLASLALLGACAIAPENDTLAEARDQVEQARQTPAVTEHAPLVLEQAEESLSRAESLWEEEGRDEMEAVEHHAYLAEQQATIALQRAARGEAQEQVEQASRTREQVLRQAREQELQAAQERAEQAEMQAESAQQRAQTVEEQFEIAQKEAETAQEEVETARTRSEEEDQQLQELRETVESLQAQQTDRGTVLTMQEVLFDFGEAELNPGGERAIEQLASFLEQNPDRQLLVEGYTDNIGDEEVNEDLARRRADAVRGQLAAAGVSEDRIQVQAHGEDYPVATNETAAGRQLNRRVEVVVGAQGEDTPEPRDSAPAATDTGSDAGVDSPEADSDTQSEANQQQGN